MEIMGKNVLRPLVFICGLVLVLGIFVLGTQFSGLISFGDKKQGTAGGLKGEIKKVFVKDELGEKDQPFEEKLDVDQLKETEFRGKLAFERERDIWSANVDGRDPQRLTTYQGLWSPDFSPDGRWIGYSSIPEELYGQGMAPTPSNIWMITPDGEEYKKLSKEYRVSTGVVWSPDSKKIAIANSDSTMVVFDIATGDELKLINDAGPLGVTPYPPIWLTADTLVYFKKLSASPDKAGLGLANIKTQETKWLVKKPGIQKVVAAGNGQKLFYLLENEFYQVDLASKKETKMNWQIPEKAEFIGNLKMIGNSNLLITPVKLDEEKLYPGLHLDFIMIETNTGKSRIIRTGLQFKKNLGWDSDGYWLVLNAVSPNDDISSTWKVNLETGKKQQIINNAFSSTWHF